jgi:alpha-amylase
MVAFRNHTQGSFFTSNWWSNGNNQIAFGRGDKGYVVINREGAALSRTFQTGMAAGTYCNIIVADFNSSNGSCSGQTITVNGSGQFTASVPANGALAIHVGAKLGGGGSTPTPTPSPAPSPTPSPTPTASTANVTFSVNATTVWGQNVFVVGNVAALGSWNTANAKPLSSASYPIWSATLSLPANSAVEYKYIKKDGSGNVVWESGANRVFTSPAGGGSTTRSDTWRN